MRLALRVQPFMSSGIGALKEHAPSLIQRRAGVLAFSTTGLGVICFNHVLTTRDDKVYR